MAGGTPILIPAIGVCDGIAMGHVGMKYSLASRELICDSVETMFMAHQLDGLVLVPNCDKIVPGMVMAAVRMDVPAVVCSGGPMLAGRYGGEEVSLSKMFEAVGAYKAGLIDDEQLEDCTCNCCPGCGSCATACPMPVASAAPAAIHTADGAALGQIAALADNQVGRGQFQCEGKLNFLIPGVIGGGDADTPLQKDHWPVAAVPAGARHVKHFGVLPALGSAAGDIIGHTGAQKLQLTLFLVFTDQMGQQGFHRAALHRGDRQIRRRYQQHAGTLFFVVIS